MKPCNTSPCLSLPVLCPGCSRQRPDHGFPLLPRIPIPSRREGAGHVAIAANAKQPDHMKVYRAAGLSLAEADLTAICDFNAANLPGWTLGSARVGGDIAGRGAVSFLGAGNEEPVSFDLKELFKFEVKEAKPFVDLVLKVEDNRLVVYMVFAGSRKSAKFVVPVEQDALHDVNCR